MVKFITWLLAGTAVIGSALTIAIIAFLPFTWVWNAVMPAVFDLRTINVWQSMGLLFISSILFKSSFSSSSSKSDND